MAPNHMSPKRQPNLHTFSSFNKSSTYTVNKNAEAKPPCLTPLLISKNLDSSPHQPISPEHQILYTNLTECEQY